MRFAGDSGDAERSVLDSTSDDPDGWYADDRRPSRLRRILVRPATLLLLGLVLLSLVAERALLGSGYLQGGALLPAPDGVGELWGSYLTAWHEVGPGSSADAPAWLAPLSLLALLLRGSASAANDVVLLALVPLAGLTAYLATRGLLRTPVARAWVAVTYATLPAATGAISGGRLGTAVAMVLLPWLVRSCARLAGVAEAAASAFIISRTSKVPMTLHPQLGAPRQGCSDPGSALPEIAHGTFNRTACCFRGFVNLWDGPAAFPGRPPHGAGKRWRKRGFCLGRPVIWLRSKFAGNRADSRK